MQNWAYLSHLQAHYEKFALTYLKENSLEH